MPGARGEGDALSGGAGAAPLRRGRPRVSLRTALVVFKKSAYQIYVRERREGHIARLVRGGHESVAHMRKVDADQREARRKVGAALERLGIRATFQWRAEHYVGSRHDIVLAVGGDGTLLEASHAVGRTPILGVNSSPETSVGYFAAATPDDLEERLGQFMSGRLAAVPLYRMRVRVAGKDLRVPVLNDALFCNENPAATSRYILRVGRVREEQKSSGMWISTAAGSTAALRSAGGAVLPAGSRRLAYIVREPYADPGTRVALRGGSVPPGGRLSVVSKMRKSGLYVDGSHAHVALRLGDLVEFLPHPEPLRLIGFRRR